MTHEAHSSSILLSTLHRQRQKEVLVSGRYSLLHLHPQCRQHCRLWRGIRTGGRGSETGLSNVEKQSLMPPPWDSLQGARESSPTPYHESVASAPQLALDIESSTRPREWD